MISAERRERIKTILLKKKSVTVSDMAQMYEVSTETIRRDFEALSAEGFLIKSYGGATLSVRKNIAVSQKIKFGIMTETKKRMAKEAAKLCVRTTAFSWTTPRRYMRYVRSWLECRSP